MSVAFEFTEEELRVLLYALDKVPKAYMGQRAREVRTELYFKLAGKFLTREEKKDGSDS